MPPRILAVEDDEIQARILGLQLKNDYEVVQAASGEECLQKVHDGEFELILLDVMLPGISGYDVCRRLKEDEATRNIPVIFLSANFTMEDRLRGFEAGGFDYMVKPVVRAELLRKIALLVEHTEEKRNLRRSADFATNTAMTAMTSAAEQGLVLQFMKTSFGCNSYQELGEAVIEALQRFGLDGAVQVRGRFGTVSRGNEGPCTPLEESVLANVAMGGRIVDLKNRTAINFLRASLLVKNMPIEDEERYGRLKDHLAMLLEGADARVAALDMDMYLAAEAKRLVAAVNGINGTLIEVNRKSHDLHKQFSSLFNKLAQRLEGIIPLLELNGSQESMLEDLLAQTSSAYVALADQEAELDRDLFEAMAQLQKISRPEPPSAQ